MLSHYCYHSRRNSRYRCFVLVFFLLTLLPAVSVALNYYATCSAASFSLMRASQRTDDLNWTLPIQNQSEK
uniref:Putative secreted protein n=1 Tax=Anopheles darlingi TaxID=43151 RepID=A0A2M4D8D9_ANODA